MSHRIQGETNKNTSNHSIGNESIVTTTLTAKQPQYGVHISRNWNGLARVKNHGDNFCDVQRKAIVAKQTKLQSLNGFNSPFSSLICLSVHIASQSNRRTGEMANKRKLCCADFFLGPMWVFFLLVYFSIIKKSRDYLDRLDLER